MVVVPSGYQHGGATALHVRVGSSAGALVSRPRWSRQRSDHGEMRLDERRMYKEGDEAWGQLNA